MNYLGSESKGEGKEVESSVDCFDYSEEGKEDSKKVSDITVLVTSLHITPSKGFASDVFTLRMVFTLNQDALASEWVIQYLTDLSHEKILLPIGSSPLLFPLACLLSSFFFLLSSFFVPLYREDRGGGLYRGRE